MAKMVDATVWLTLEPTFYKYGPSSDLPNGMRVAKMTTKRPTSGNRPCVKLTMRLPAAAFKPLAPDVTIEVPEEALVWPEPTITVDPHPEP